MCAPYVYLHCCLTFIFLSRVLMGFYCSDGCCCCCRWCCSYAHKMHSKRTQRCTGQNKYIPSTLILTRMRWGSLFIYLFIYFFFSQFSRLVKCFPRCVSVIALLLLHLRMLDGAMRDAQCTFLLHTRAITSFSNTTSVFISYTYILYCVHFFLFYVDGVWKETFGYAFVVYDSRPRKMRFYNLFF